MCGAVLAAGLTDGNLLVVQVGEGVARSGVTGHPAFALEINASTGSVVQSFPLPVVGSGANHAFILTRGSVNDGGLSISDDGNYFTSFGYDASVDQGSLSGSSLPRVVARIDRDGQIDTSTAITSDYATRAPRGVVSKDGMQFWMVASGSGIRYATLGSSTTVLVNDTGASLITNARSINIEGGQLRVATGQGGFNGISDVGVGLPSGGGNSTSLLPGFGTLSGTSPVDFFQADATTIYMSDDSVAPLTGGVQKWEFAFGSWSFQEIITSGLPVGARVRQMTGWRDAGNNVVLVASVVDDSGASTLQKIVLDSPGASFTTLATAPANTTFRGVEYIPPASGCLRGACVADFDDGTGSGTPDGGVTIDDLLYFLARFDAGDLAADLDDGSGLGAPDGGVTIDDLLFFLERFDAGC